VKILRVVSIFCIQGRRKEFPMFMRNRISKWLRTVGERRQAYLLGVQFRGALSPGIITLADVDGVGEAILVQLVDWVFPIETENRTTTLGTDILYNNVDDVKKLVLDRELSIYVVILYVILARESTVV
jgi:hypothetical protein